MSPEEIKHFLVIYDPEAGKTTVRRFGTDYEAARIAYARAEQENGLSEERDIVPKRRFAEDHRKDAFQLFQWRR